MAIQKKINFNVSSFKLDTQGWSCCFDSKSPHYIFAGLANNSKIQIFDIRNNSQPVKSIQNDQMGGVGKSVHSLYSIEGLDSILGGSLGCTFLINPAQDKSLITSESYTFSTFNNGIQMINIIDA